MLAMFPSFIQIFVKMLTEEIVKLKVKVLLTIRDRNEAEGLQDLGLLRCQR